MLRLVLLCRSERCIALSVRALASGSRLVSASLTHSIDCYNVPLWYSSIYPRLALNDMPMQVFDAAWVGDCVRAGHRIPTSPYILSGTVYI